MPHLLLFRVEARGCECVLVVLFLLTGVHESHARTLSPRGTEKRKACALLAA